VCVSFVRRYLERKRRCSSLDDSVYSFILSKNRQNRYQSAQIASSDRINLDSRYWALSMKQDNAHVDDTYYYGAYCRKCKHSARLSLTKLRAHLGDTFPLVKVKGKLRCERCSSRQIVITLLAPDQRTGNLVELFSRKPGE
jgi:hypothetical protein